MPTTHTFVTMEISAAAYDEIASKLLEAEYNHAFLDGAAADGGTAIDMHGIALVRAKEADVVESVLPHG